MKPDLEAKFQELALNFRHTGGLAGHAEMEGKTLFLKSNTGPSGHGSPPAAGEALALKRAGAGASDEDRYRLLLANLAGVPSEKRAARFRCVVAVVTPEGDVHTAEGHCKGLIGFEPRGRHGFGYDPVFYLPERDQTMAQLPPEVKNRISHRARALQAALPMLRRLLAEGAGGK